MAARVSYEDAMATLQAMFPKWDRPSLGKNRMNQNHQIYNSFTKNNLYFTDNQFGQHNYF